MRTQRRGLRSGGGGLTRTWRRTRKAVTRTERGSKDGGFTDTFIYNEPGKGMQVPSRGTRRDRRDAAVTPP